MYAHVGNESRGIGVKRAGAAIVAVALAAAVAACGGKDSPSTKSAGCQKIDKVSFGMISPSAGYWLPLYADEAGLWAENCIKLDVVTIASSSNLLTAVTTQDLQLAAVPTDIGFKAIQSGNSLVAVASNQKVNDGTFVGRPEIKRLQDLRGKTICTASIASTSTLAIRQLLSKAGVRPDEYQIITGGGSAERQAALSAGAFQATWLLAPGDLTLLEKGFTDLGALGSAFPQDQYSSVFANPKWAQANKDLMIRIMRVWAAASKAFDDAKNRKRFEKVLVDAARATPEVAAATYDRYRRLNALSPDGRIEPAGAFSVLDLMTQMKTLDKVPTDASKYVDLSYWSEATGEQAPKFVKSS